MDMRPRCREWLPLATQQLRLRNLVRILGYNIHCAMPGEILVYYTLHDRRDAPPFYVSETLPRRHLQLKWADINCAQMLKSTANCVCIKVWARPHAPTPSPSALTPRPPDQLLFAWGVYFSGLVPLGANTDAKCRSDSLLFQINGDLFIAPDSLTLESLRDELSTHYHCYAAQLPARHASGTPPLPTSRAASPSAFVEQQQLYRMSIGRHLQIDFPRADTRGGYSLAKLLRMQALQWQRLQRRRQSLELVDAIQRLSVDCVTPALAQRKPRTASHSGGRSLSILLAEQPEIEPAALLRAQQLRKQIELLRGQTRLLDAEQKTYAQRVAERRQRLTALTAGRRAAQTALEERIAQLQVAKERLAERQTLLERQRLAKRHVERDMARRTASLVRELSEIYPISRNALGLHTICGIPLPNMDAYCNDPKYANGGHLAAFSPMSLNAGLGYLAHLVQMIAAIVDRPLRNPIQHEGSRSRIKDIVKDLPLGGRIFPLYTRSSLPSNAVKYAIQLLNQNVAQLCYEMTKTRCDRNATIENVLCIFQFNEAFERQTRLPQSSENGDDVDGSSGGGSGNSIDYCDLKLRLLEMPCSEPIAIAAAAGAAQQRVCRSVGSYSDCEDGFDVQCFSNSDSNLKFQSGHL